MDVGEGGRVWRFRRNAKVQGHHDDAVSSQRFVADVAVLAVTIHPGAAMQLDHYRERSAPLGLEEARQEELITVPQIFHVFDLDFISGLCADSHAKLL